MTSGARQPIDRRRRERPIDTAGYSAELRDMLIDTDLRAIKLTHFGDSQQSNDLRELPNSGGYGRIHHFSSDEGSDWPANPLPIEPACRALGIDIPTSMNAQVFQSSGCNWRCWYCYVPFEDLTGRRGAHVTVRAMVDGYLALDDRPRVVDLSGGQPDLTPEWPVWFLTELRDRGIDDCYVWSDDNLSTDYLWRYVSEDDRALLDEHANYGRACCLKGYDEHSFAFNTKASPNDFSTQFELLDRLRNATNIDFYVYVTFTAPSIDDGLAKRVGQFVDRLQSVSPTLPLRTVPLKVLEWGPVGPRLNNDRRAALHNQHEVVRLWQHELEDRFSPVERQLSIVDIPK